MQAQNQETKVQKQKIKSKVIEQGKRNNQILVKVLVIVMSAEAELKMSYASATNCDQR